MDIYEPQTIGVGVMALTSVLGAYYLILKIRSYHTQVRDPALTYVTHSQMDKLRCEFMRIVSEAAHDLRTLRCEIREDTRSMQRQHSKSLEEMRELISRNAQSISAIAAQMQLANQRISEIALRADKLSLKFQR